jgi:DNA-binding GntR family transcriptional regulator
MGVPAKRRQWRRPGDSVERVRARLERRILEGQLAPGSRLVEQEICRRVGCGRSPVREALRLLAADGLVESHPRRGARVSRITAEEVRDTFEVFEALETLGTRLAARRGGPGHGARFGPVLDAMQRAVAARDLRAYFRLNARFHRTIYERSGNRTLTRLLLNLGKQITRFRLTALSSPGRMAASLREHRALAHALMAGDEEVAVRLARGSVANARRALAEAIGLAGRLAGRQEEEDIGGKARRTGGADHRRQSRARQGDRAGVR